MVNFSWNIRVLGCSVIVLAEDGGSAADVLVDNWLEVIFYLTFEVSSNLIIEHKYQTCII
jgi:hypothetical protein